MNNCKIECTKDQLHLIQKALDFYSRVGIGQFTEIKDHPTFEEHLYKEFALGKGAFKVGDKTMRGEVIEIDKKGKWIKTKGSWGNGEEIKKWTDVDKIQHSTDYSLYHSRRDEIDKQLNIARNLLYNEFNMSHNGSWGIYNPKVGDSCREAFKIIEKIRHQFWLANPDRSDMTVDSTDGRSNVIVKID